MTRKEQIEAMLAEAPDDRLLRYGLAMEHASAGDDASAVREFRELLRRDASYVPAYMQAGRALIRIGDDEEASAVLKHGIIVARSAGDEHAAGEMEGFLAGIAE